MREFQEKYNNQISIFSTGATTEKFTPYYPMLGYRRIDFKVAGLVKRDVAGAAGATLIQQFTIRALQASDSTGGGASAISSATAIIGKDSATGVSTAAKCREGWVNFTTLTSAVPVTLTVGTAVYTGATAAAVMSFACASAAASGTVAAQAFVTMFNSTVNNTATAITANWEASTEAAGVAWVRILPKDPNGTHLLHLGTTGSSQIGVGGVFTAHIGIDQQYMGEGKTHIALGVKSTNDTCPFVVSVVRESYAGPVKSVSYSKSLNASTSK